MSPAFQSVDSLVVRCPNWVGDIVMATPVYECLRQNFPNATITALVKPYARSILEDSPWFDHIVNCEDKSIKGLKKIRRELSPLKPQVGILLTNTTHSWLTFKFAGIPQLYGYRRNLRKYFLSGGPEPIMEDGRVKPQPMQDYYLEICRFLGLTMPEAPKVSLGFSSQLEEQAKSRLKEWGINACDKVVGLNPGASFGSSKCWPPEYFAHLAELLQSRYQAKIILFVGPGEQAIASEIVSSSEAEIINTSNDIIGLGELKPLIKRCDLLITNDTGPRHYAVAFDTPHIVLMGPTNPLYTASNQEYSTVLQKDLLCVPCHKKTCPLGHHACMTEITPSLVMDAVANIFPEQSS